MTGTDRRFQNGRAGEDTCSNPRGRKEMLMKRKQLTTCAAKTLAVMLAGAAAFGGLAAAPQTVWAETIVDQARTTGMLTITKQDNTKKPLAGAEFSLYRVMNLTPGSKPGEFASYAVNDNFKEVLRDITPDELDNYNTQQLENKIRELEALVEKNQIQADQKDTSGDNGEIRFADLELGYYLVRETKTPAGYVNGNAFLVAIPSTNNYDQDNTAGTEWVYDIQVEPKNSVVDIEKELGQEGQDHDGSIKVGDLVPYTIKTTVPVYPDSYFEQDVTFKIYDVTSNGLKVVNRPDKSVQVYVDGQPLEAMGNYSLEVKEAAGQEADLTIAFTKDFIRNNGNKNVEVRYWAEVTDAAVIGQEGNTNNVQLEYNNGPGETTKADGNEVRVYSFGINVAKFTKNGGEKPLAGAEFKLYADAELTQELATAKSNDQGHLQFDEQLDEGTYYLKETKSPAGYTLLTNPIKVEITAKEDQEGHATGEFTVKVNDQEITATTGDYTTHLDQAEGTVTVAVENHKGFTLPATGGTGIALFLLIGAAGILTVSAVLVKKSRKAAK